MQDSKMTPKEIMIWKAMILIWNELKIIMDDPDEQLDPKLRTALLEILDTVEKNETHPDIKKFAMILTAQVRNFS